MRRLESGAARAEDAQQIASDLTFWVMTFQDVLRSNRKRVQSPALQDVAQHHLHEDSGHEQWFWQDAKALSALRSAEWYFGPEHAEVREVSLEIASEVFRAESDEARITLILALEAAGEVFFPRVVAYFQRAVVGVELHYFAQTHREVERNHAVFEHETQDLLQALQVQEPQIEALCQVVSRVFATFERLSRFLEAHLEQHAPELAPSTPVADFIRRAEDSGLSLALGSAAEPFGADFGGLREASVVAVVQIRDREQVPRALHLARAARTGLALRGGGNSQSGQSLPTSGITLDLGALEQLSIDPHERSATCEASVSWRQLIERSLEHDLVPKVMPLNLDLSVAGTLSAGGIGSSSHVHRTAATHVERLLVVTGAGEELWCGREEHPELFDAVLANQGRCAVITAAKLALRAARPRVHSCALRYDRLSALLNDMRSLAEHARVDHMEAMCGASFLGLRRAGPGYVPLRRWGYTLHLAIEQHPTIEQKAELDLKALSGSLGAAEVVLQESNDVKPFLARYDARFRFMRETGAWQQTHPWFEWILPYERAEELVAFALDRLPPVFGDGHRIFYLPGGGYPRYFRVPGGEHLIGLAVLPAGIPKAQAAKAREAAGVVDRHLLEQGAKRYLSGWIENPDAAFFHQHFAEDYPAWCAAKRRWDPHHVLKSMLFANCES
jgi:cytokinin dehydrogenase